MKFVLPLLIVASQAVAAPVIDLFFAGGQSNATAQWRDGIEAGLLASGLFTNPQVAWIQHSGTPISTWHTEDEKKDYYFTDFYSSPGSGLLQQSIFDLQSAGYEVHFRGLFWFQGEADAGDPAGVAPSLWGQRFGAMVNDIDTDLGNSDWKIMITLVDLYGSSTYNGDDYPPMAELRQVMRDFVTTWEDRALSIDSRSYERTDLLHLTPAEAERLGYDSGAQFATFAVPEPSIAWLLLCGTLLLPFCRSVK